MAGLAGALMKHVTIIGMGCLLAVALSWALISCSVPYHSDGSFGIRCGVFWDIGITLHMSNRQRFK